MAEHTSEKGSRLPSPHCAPPASRPRVRSHTRTMLFGAFLSSHQDGPGQSAAMANVLQQVLSQIGGGIATLISRFTDAGLGDHVQSWAVRSKPLPPITSGECSRKMRSRIGHPRRAESGPRNSEWRATGRPPASDDRPFVAGSALSREPFSHLLKTCGPRS